METEKASTWSGGCEHIVNARSEDIPWRGKSSKNSIMIIKHKNLVNVLVRFFYHYCRRPHRLKNSNIKDRIPWPPKFGGLHFLCQSPDCTRPENMTELLPCHADICFHKYKAVNWDLDWTPVKLMSPKSLLML